MGTAIDEKSLNLFAISKSVCYISKRYRRKNGFIQSVEPNANVRALLNCLEFDEYAWHLSKFRCLTFQLLPILFHSWICILLLIALSLVKFNCNYY